MFVEDLAAPTADILAFQEAWLLRCGALYVVRAGCNMLRCGTAMLLWQSFKGAVP